MCSSCTFNSIIDLDLLSDMELFELYELLVPGLRALLVFTFSALQV